LIVLAFFLLSLRAIRIIPILAFVSLPVLLFRGSSLSEECRAMVRRFGMQDSGRCLKGFSYGLSLVLIAGLFLVYSNRYYIWQRTPDRFALGISPTQYPAGAARFIQRRGMFTRGFNTFAEGGFLMWALPESKVFVDGRADIYGEEFMTRYWQAMNDPQKFGSMLDSLKVRAVLLPAGLPIIVRILPWISSRPGWALIYFDESSLLYVRRKGVDKKFLERYEIKEGKRGGRMFRPSITEATALPGQLLYPWSSLKIGISYEWMGQSGKALEYYLNAQELSRHLPAEIYYNAGRIYLQIGKYPEAISQMDRALIRNPKMAKAHHALGIAFFKEENLLKAKHHWEESLRLDPNLTASRDYLRILQKIGARHLNKS